MKFLKEISFSGQSTPVTPNPGYGSFYVNTNNKPYFIDDDGITYDLTASSGGTDIFVSGGTYNNGTLSFTNTSGGTFTVTGLTSSQGDTNGLVLYLDTTGGTYTSTEIIGEILRVPNTGLQTTIVSTDNGTRLVASFLSDSTLFKENIIPPGLWLLHLYASRNSGDVQFYYEISYVDSDGISNKTLIVSGQNNPIHITSNDDIMYGQSLYSNTVTLPSLDKRLVIDVYTVTSGSHTTTLYFRDQTVSHIHTPLVIEKDTYVTGGTYSNETLTLTRNDDVDVVITGFTPDNAVIVSATSITGSSIRKDNGNTTDSENSTISGGYNNTISNYSNFSTIAGGSTNTISTYSFYSNINGGLFNEINNGFVSTISGGYGNGLQGDSSIVVGGRNNVLNSNCSSIVGGLLNNTSSDYSFIGGGKQNFITTSPFSTISGGYANIMNDSNYSFIGGGYANSIDSAKYSTIGGGYNNKNYSSGSTIVGGMDSIIDINSPHSTVVGGYGQIAGSSSGSTIIGGYCHSINGQSYHSTIVGGRQNTVTAFSEYSSILGGELNSTNFLTNTHIIGSNIIAISANTTHVNNLNIYDIPQLDNTLSNLLVRDTNGMIRYREVSSITSGISTTDTFVTGGTYSNGTSTFTNNTGGTFSVSGYSTTNIIKKTNIILTSTTWVSGTTFTYDHTDSDVSSGDTIIFTPAMTTISVVIDAIIYPEIITSGGTFTLYAQNQPSGDIEGEYLIVKT